MDWETAMREAIALGETAAALGEIPVGAVIVKDGQIVGRGYNRREMDHDATGHAEIMAIRDACRTLNTWRLTGCTLFVTLEPCPMCTGAILQSRISKVVFGAFDEKAGCCGSRMNFTAGDLDCNIEVYGGVLVNECFSLMKDFFHSLRKNEK